MNIENNDNRKQAEAFKANLLTICNELIGALLAETKETTDA